MGPDKPLDRVTRMGQGNNRGKVVQNGPVNRQRHKA
jgi:hypothetical protein